jgi:hypothetical protein
LFELKRPVYSSLFVPHPTGWAALVPGKSNRWAYIRKADRDAPGHGALITDAKDDIANRDGNYVDVRIETIPTERWIESSSDSEMNRPARLATNNLEHFSRCMNLQGKRASI